MSHNNPPTNPWTFLSARDIYQNPWIKLVEHNVTRPDGTAGIYSIVHFHPAIGVVPVDDEGRITLVGQWRVPLNRYSWEIPEGGCAKNEPPLNCAKRELHEEAGFAADHWYALGQIATSNSCTDEIGHLFVAWGLTDIGAAPEPDEVLRLRKVSFTELQQLILQNDIDDGLTLAAILRLKLALEVGQLPPTLAALLGKG